MEHIKVHFTFMKLKLKIRRKMKKINKKFISMLLVIILVTGCGCNKQKFADGLATLGKEQLTELIEEDGKAEIQCQFCYEKGTVKL